MEMHIVYLMVHWLVLLGASLARSEYRACNRAEMHDGLSGEADGHY